MLRQLVVQHEARSLVWERIDQSHRGSLGLEVFLPTCTVNLKVICIPKIQPNFYTYIYKYTVILPYIHGSYGKKGEKVRKQ